MYTKTKTELHIVMIVCILIYLYREDAVKEELHESCRLLYSLKVRTVMVHVFVSSRLHWTGEVIYTVLPSTLGEHSFSAKLGMGL